MFNKSIFILLTSLFFIPVSLQFQSFEIHGEETNAEVLLNADENYSRISTDQNFNTNWENLRIRKVNNLPVTSSEKEAIEQATSMVLEDFQVNQNVGKCVQANPAVAMNGQGDFAITWIDFRDHYQASVFARCFDKYGKPRGPSFRVSEVAHSPAIGMDEAGNFVITYVEIHRPHDPFIFAKRYNCFGEPIGGRIKVHDDPWNAYNWQQSPDIAVRRDGKFIITWVDQRPGHPYPYLNIYAQRFHAKGDTVGLGGNFQVNDEIKKNECWQPAVSFSDNGNFLITWEDKRNGNFDIYAQHFDSTGHRLQGNFRVDNDTQNKSQNHPVVAMSETGNFVIAWEDNRTDNWNIFAQCYDFNGIALTTNFKVNEEVGTDYDRMPEISTDRNGNFDIVWKDGAKEYADVYIQRFNASGQPLGSNIRINDDPGKSLQGRPSIAKSPTGKTIVAWNDFRNGDEDIYAQLYDSTGLPIGNNFKANDEASAQLEPAIAVDETGNFMIVWEDLRNGHFDIYGQRYDFIGYPLDSNFRVNDDIGKNVQRYPDIAVHKDGSFIIVWQDKRNGNPDIYLQRYNSDGQEIAQNFRVNDDPGKSAQRRPQIDIDARGNFVITWEDERQNSVSNIYAQYFNANGDTSGTNFIVNDDVLDCPHQRPAIAVNDSGNFVITWRDFRNGVVKEGNWENPDIHAQCYQSSGTPSGANFQVNNDNITRNPCYPAVDIKNDGEFVITWEEYLISDSKIYAQYFHSNGDTLGPNFWVIYHGYYPAVAFDSGGNFVITWRHLYGSIRYDIYARCFNKNGVALNDKWKVNNDPGGGKQYHPDVATLSDKIYFTWEDNRFPVQGMDIFAKIVAWDSLCPPENENFLTSENSKTFSLSQNYPNPFNSETTFNYRLSQDCFVTLRIFNILGQEIATLVNQWQASGRHAVRWNANELASGMYLYKLEAHSAVSNESTVEFSEVKKFMVFK